jgi:hypothetical protein
VYEPPYHRPQTHRGDGSLLGRTGYRENRGGPRRPCTVGFVEDTDRDVLEFIGDQGKTAEQVSDRFPAFDLERLVRAELVRPRRTNPGTFYVLTSRGAEAIGLEPHTLHSD